jgi:hypothetical protein
MWCSPAPPKFSKSLEISFMISSMKALLKCNLIVVPSKIQNELLVHGLKAECGVRWKKVNSDKITYKSVKVHCLPVMQLCYVDLFLGLQLHMFCSCFPILLVNEILMTFFRALDFTCGMLFWSYLILLLRSPFLLYLVAW